jgi:lipoprotein-releasing system permease protein
MFKAFLCLRYLRTRYIALASIISVMLGVATMIVVNSVMAGFQTEMYKRLHGILSDIVVEAHSLEGIEDPERLKAEVAAVVGEDLEGMTPAVHLPAMLTFPSGGQWITRQVNLIGIDEATYAKVSDFSKYLLHPENRRDLCFDLRDGGYDPRLPSSGWAHRRVRVESRRMMEQHLRELDRHSEQRTGRMSADEQADSEQAVTVAEVPQDPFAAAGRSAPDEPTSKFDEKENQYTGIILGIAIASVPQRTTDGEVESYFLCRPGDDVKAVFPSAGEKPEALRQTFTVVDFYESKMSEYDASFAFVPLQALQRSRGMGNAVTSLQIKLRPGADLQAVRDRLRDRFPAQVFPYRIQTWKDMQGPLLAAVQMETTILNILLFLIIAVAGFGILATFFMIVVEKTRDIGILKSLGASSGGVMSIFLAYGLSLGTVGAGVGLVLGLLFVININQIAAGLEWVTGREVFDPTVYYFQEIPTILSPITIAWIVSGAMVIAVLASVLPALRAARLHPVEALRYE